MNSSDIWFGRDSCKRLPAPVILPDTFIEHKKTLLTSPNEMKTNDSNTGTTTTIQTMLGKSINSTTKCYNKIRIISPTLTSSFCNGGGGGATDPLYDGMDNSKNCLFYRQTNNYNPTLLNTPVASRSMPYKRCRIIDNETGPINLSKNELDMSLYDHSKNLSFLDQSYNLNYMIDKGTFSEVFHAQNKIDGQFYAIKVLNLIQKHNFMFKYNEVRMLDKISPHINIIHFDSAWREFDYMFIRTELCLDNFSNMLVIKRIEESELIIFLAHSLNGIKHIHSFNIVHMDIKSSNILLGLDGNYKIADFGLAAFPYQKEISWGVTEGDSRYMASELLNNVVSPSVDIFSLGMSLIEAIFNINLPVDGELWHQLRQGVLPNFDLDVVDYSSDLLVRTKQMISYDPLLRPTPNDLFEWNELNKALHIKSKYFDILLPRYESILFDLNNFSDSSYSSNHYCHNSTEMLTCSTPVLFIPSTKRIRKNSISSVVQHDHDDNSDIIELNFSD